MGIKNKLDAYGTITRNKLRLVVQGYNHEERIDYHETFVIVAGMEAIKIMIAFAGHKEFRLFQMDVKSSFLIGNLNKEVYVKQTPGFKDAKLQNHVLKQDKALYSLKQAP